MAKAAANRYSTVLIIGMVDQLIFHRSILWNEAPTLATKRVPRRQRRRQPTSLLEKPRSPSFLLAGSTAGSKRELSLNALRKKRR